MSKPINSLLFTFVLSILLILPSVVICLKCTNDTTCTSGTPGEFSFCENELCVCMDFYGIVGRTCVRGAKYGGRCTVSGECGIELGATTSRCNVTTGRCECFDITGEAGYLDGKCHKLKMLGETCNEDGQCILGTNILSRCDNGTCQCYSTENIKLIVGEDGFCQMEDPAQCPDPGTNFSVFAATAAGSVALFVVIVLIYQVTRPGQPK